MQHDMMAIKNAPRELRTGNRIKRDLYSIKNCSPNNFTNYTHTQSNLCSLLSWTYEVSLPKECLSNPLMFLKTAVPFFVNGLTNHRFNF